MLTVLCVLCASFCDTSGGFNLSAVRQNEVTGYPFLEPGIALFFESFLLLLYYYLKYRLSRKNCKKIKYTKSEKCYIFQNEVAGYSLFE